MLKIIKNMSNTESNEFKDRLKRLRKDKGWSSEDLALLVQKSSSTVRTWESGKNMPDTETIILLATLFCCSTDFLLGLTRYRSREDLKISVNDLKSFEKTFVKLQDRNMSSVFDRINDFLEAFVSNDFFFANGDHFKTDIVFNGLLDLIDGFRRMCEKAEYLSTKLKEYGIQHFEDCDYPDELNVKTSYGLLPFLEFINTRTELMKTISELYDNLASHAGRNLEFYVDKRGEGEHELLERFDEIMGLT